MAAVNYNNRRFRFMPNGGQEPQGETTIFEYFQEGQFVWGNYKGGSVHYGTFIATVDDQGVLDLRYHHLGTDHILYSGKSLSTPEVMPDGRIRLNEHFEWTTGASGPGFSVVEEIR